MKCTERCSDCVFRSAEDECLLTVESENVLKEVAVCSNCRHNIPPRDRGYQLWSYCEVDNSYIGYTKLYTKRCEHWESK